MFILTADWDLRLVWTVLTITSKFYILFMLAAGVFSTCSLARIRFRLQKLLTHATSSDPIDMRVRLAKMRRGIAGLCQFHALLFLLFGVCCTNEVFATLRMIQYSSMSLSAAKIDIFEPITAFSFFVFTVLIFLHAFQWVVAAHLQSVCAMVCRSPD